MMCAVASLAVTATWHRSECDRTDGLPNPGSHDDTCPNKMAAEAIAHRRYKDVVAPTRSLSTVSLLLLVRQGYGGQFRGLLASLRER